MKKYVFVLMFMLTAFVEVKAQVPQGINYQAVARDASGATLDAATGTVTIQILDNINGNVLYAETHDVTTNQFGLFTLLIGQGTATQGTFSTINWSVGDKYLQVQADFGNGIEDMGTTQLLSVPYALYAETSGDGPPGKNSVLRVDSIASGGTCPYGGIRVSYGLDDNGNGVLDIPAEVDGFKNVCRVNVSGGGGGIDTVYIAGDSLYVVDVNGNVTSSLLADNDWIVDANGNVALFTPSANVGIGTTSPTAKLDVNGTINISDTLGEVNKVTTGTANLIPIAYGKINSFGNILSGSGNITVSWNTTHNRYEISISNENYYGNYTTVVTLLDCGSCPGYLVRTRSISNKLLVMVYDLQGNKVQNGFSFVIYKP